VAHMAVLCGQARCGLERLQTGISAVRGLPQADVLIQSAVSAMQLYRVAV
jgi:hypothetical protein